MTRNQAAARFLLGLAVFVVIIAWCIWWVPEPFRWVITVYAFVACPTILIIIIAIQNRRPRGQEPELYEPPAPRRHNNRGFQLRVQHSSAEKGGRKFA